MKIKAVLSIVLAAIMPLSITACGQSKPATLDNSAPKEIIKLQNNPYIEVSMSDPIEKAISFECGELTEMKAQPYKKSNELKIFADYIKSEFGIALDNNWLVHIQYYDTDKTGGAVEFDYCIGDIQTDKRISFLVQNGKVEYIYYRNLDSKIDETALKKRVEHFKGKYEQEQYQPKDGEVIDSEESYISYYFETGDLIYNYYIFVSDVEGLTKDFGTICRIDENGDAIPDDAKESASSSQYAENPAEYEGLDDEPYIPNITLEMLDNAPTIEAVTYSGMWEAGMILLLGKDEEAGVSVYSIDVGGNYVLRVGDEIYVLEDELGGPQYYGTEFSMVDLDNDGEDEFALIVCRGSGTGFFRMEISVYEKENGQYKRYTPDYSVFVEKVSDWFKEQNPDIDNYVFGDIYDTRISGDNIVVTFSPGFMNEGVAYPEYDVTHDVMADIKYSKDGSFYLTDIRPVDNNLSY